jgi:O-antigen/teichoic acid export membrane protein
MVSTTQIAPLPKGVSINRQILRAAALVTAAGILVKAVATLKEIAVAGVYGRSDDLDAFLAAALIPGLLINLISESMNQALVPTLVRVREQEGHDRAQQLLSSSMLWMCALLGAVSVLPADCLAFSGREDGPGGTAFLWSAAGCPHHRSSHQLHRRSEYT